MGAAVIETLLQLTGRTKTWPKFVRRFTSLVHVPSCGYIAGILATASAAKDCGRRERFWFGLVLPTMHLRSEERRVGKEGRCRWGGGHAEVEDGVVGMSS